METLKLSVSQRAVLLQILPQESDYLTYKILRDLKSQLGFSEEEFIKFEIVHKDKVLTWNKSKEEDKEVSIGDKGLDIIITALKKLNDEKKINDTSGPIYEMFVKE